MSAVGAPLPSNLSPPCVSRVLVRSAEGAIITVYPLIRPPLSGGRVRTDDRGGGLVPRNAVHPRGKFSATRIRHADRQSRPIGSLVVPVIEKDFCAALVPGPGVAGESRAALASAGRAAVRLASFFRSWR